MSRTPYLDLNIPDKSSKGFVVTDVFEPNFTKLDQEAERVDLRKMSTEDNIEELKKSTRYKIGDVVEVLGFHAKGDGSHHKRIAKSEDDGSGEQGQNGIWWCIVHSGEVNVSWFGAIGDGDTDDTVCFKKSINVAKSVLIDVKLGLSEEITCNENQIISCSKDGCIFLISDLTTVFNLTPGNVIKNIVIDLNLKAVTNIFRISDTIKYSSFMNIQISRIVVKGGSSERGNKKFLKIESISKGYWGVFVDNVQILCPIHQLLHLFTAEGSSGWLTGMTFSDCSAPDGCSQILFAENLGTSQIAQMKFENLQTQTWKNDNDFKIKLINADTLKFDNICCFDFWHSQWIQTNGLFDLGNSYYCSFINLYGPYNRTDIDTVDFIKNYDETLLLEGKLFRAPNVANRKTIVNNGLFFAQNMDKIFKIAEVQGATGCVVNVKIDYYVLASSVGNGQVAQSLCLQFIIGSSLDSSRSYGRNDDFDFYLRNTGDVTEVFLKKKNRYNYNFIDIDLAYGSDARFNRCEHLFESITSDVVYVQHVSLTSLETLDTPYYTLKMQQEGIYEDYVSYRDELHEYENSQTSGDTMMLTVLHEPIIPESVELFAKKYNLT